jgi:hypothetical protein
VSKPWNKTTLEDIKNPEQLLRDAPKWLKTMDQSQLIFPLERLWELDPKSILSFEGNQSSRGARLFAFTCRSGTRIGLGPDCLQDADILCRLHGMHTVALCRGENRNYRFIGRAAIGPVDGGKRKDDVTRDHPLWPPPDLDVYIGTVDNLTLVRKWRVSITMLRALTCPLKWRRT